MYLVSFFKHLAQFFRLQDLYREFFHQDDDMPQKVPLMQLAFKTDANLDGGKLRSDDNFGTVGMCWDDDLPQKKNHPKLEML